MPPGTASPSLSRERLGFTLFLSLCVHVVLIIGLSEPVSPREDKLTRPPALDITLSPPPPDRREAPEEALTLPPESQPTPSSTGETDDERAERLAALQARLQSQQEAYAERPRRQGLSAASPLSEPQAAYLDAWRKRIEQVGNDHYPEAIRQAGLHGTLRLLVAIRADGSISELRILRSSGHPLLDEAALQIVQLAAPFAPFTATLQNDTDILDIVRTWEFRQGRTRLE